MVSSMAIALEALRSRSLSYGGWDPLDDAMTPLQDHVLINLHGTEHRSRRTVENVLFRSGNIRRVESEVLEPALAEEFLCLRDAQEDSEHIRTDLIELAGTVLMRVTASVVGLEYVNTRESARTLWHLAERIRIANSVRMSHYDKGRQEEIIRDGLVAQRELGELFLEPCLTRYQQNGGPGKRSIGDNLLSVLLKSGAANWEPGLLLREVAFFIGASFTTTTDSTAHAFAEISRWISDHPEERAHLNELDFLKNAVAESLRLHPPIGYLFRRAIEPTRIGQYALETGETVLFDLRAINIDPAVFGDSAGEFNPRRQEKSLSLTFGSGPHMCLGRPLALGAARAMDDETEAVGAIICLLKACIDHGMALDPLIAPLEDERPGHFISFPVVFSALDSTEQFSIG